MRVSHVKQGEYDWHCLRQSKVTGTRLKSALGSPKVQQTLMYELLAERMTEPQIVDINSAAITHGKESEPLARRALEKETGYKFDEVGMLISTEMDYFGVSPDGVYFQDGVLIGGLETKCPNSKKHIEYLDKAEIPPEYIHQVKAPFLLCDSLEWWVFASYDDRNYELPIFQKTFYRADYVEIENDKAKLKAFLDMVDDKHLRLTF
jgi:glutaredoxin-related protein